MIDREEPCAKATKSLNSSTEFALEKGPAKKKRNASFPEPLLQGADGSDITERKCPECQSGEPGDTV